MDKATYGLMVGERYVFLEAEKGIVFNRDTYTTISHTTSLNEIESYLNKLISQ